MDVFSGPLGNHILTPERIIELFSVCISSLNLGSIPQTLDQVIIGQADRMRPHSPKAVIVLGAVEGSFPKTPKEGGLINEEDRRRLAAVGLELPGSDIIYRLRLERYYVYFALTRASQRLYLSCSGRNTSGEEREPCEAFVKIVNLFGESESSGGIRITSRRSALEAMALGMQNETGTYHTMREYFLRYEGKDEAARIKELAGKREHVIEDKSVAAELFGKNIMLSPSKIEHYHSCAFASFCRSGLGFSEKRRAELSPLESGSVIHRVLEILFSSYGAKELTEMSETGLQTHIRSVIMQFLSERVDDVSQLSTRQTYLFSRLSQSLLMLVRHLAKELAQSRFVPEYFELPIGKGSGYSMQLVTPGGARVSVNGIVDRVDVMEKNGRKYVRVMDYKSGGKDFRLSDVYYGLNMQMLIYLFAICRDTGEQETIPAGILYVPAELKTVEIQRGEDDKELAEKHEKNLRMDGLILDDIDVIQGMEADIRGVFIPVSLKNGADIESLRNLSLEGTGPSGSQALNGTEAIANLAQLGKIRRRVESLICSMADSLRDGNIQAIPAKGSGYDLCQWCEFSVMCGFEEGDRIRRIPAIKRDELDELLAEE